MTSLIKQLQQPLKGDLDKEASAFKSRENDLSDAENKDFAAVIYDGSSMHRKFPVKTAEDVEMSKQALRRMREDLPDEIVKTARHFIDVASRRHCKEAAYDGLDEDPPSSNVVYTGDIDKKAYQRKLEEQKIQQAKEARVKGTSFSVPDVKSLREVERHFEAGVDMGPKKKAEAAQDLLKHAESMGTEVRSDEVRRFDRESLPANFVDEVEFRKMAAPDSLEEYYDELKKEASQVGTDQGMNVVEAAECLRILDKKAGFSRPGGLSKLGKNAKSAYEVAFPKEEPESPTGSDMDKISEAFGEEFAGRYQKNPDEAVSELSPTERQVLQQVS